MANTTIETDRSEVVVETPEKINTIPFNQPELPLFKILREKFYRERAKLEKSENVIQSKQEFLAGNLFEYRKLSGEILGNFFEKIEKTGSFDFIDLEEVIELFATNLQNTSKPNNEIRADVIADLALINSYFPTKILDNADKNGFIGNLGDMQYEDIFRKVGKGDRLVITIEAYSRFLFYIKNSRIELNAKTGKSKKFISFYDLARASESEKGVKNLLKRTLRKPQIDKIKEMTLDEALSLVKETLTDSKKAGFWNKSLERKLNTLWLIQNLDLTDLSKGGVKKVKDILDRKVTENSEIVDKINVNNEIYMNSSLFTHKYAEYVGHIIIRTILTEKVQHLFGYENEDDDSISIEIDKAMNDINNYYPDLINIIAHYEKVVVQLCSMADTDYLFKAKMQLLYNLLDPGTESTVYNKFLEIDKTEKDDIRKMAEELEAIYFKDITDNEGFYLEEAETNKFSLISKLKRNFAEVIEEMVADFYKNDEGISYLGGQNGVETETAITFPMYYEKRFQGDRTGIKGLSSCLVAVKIAGIFGYVPYDVDKVRGIKSLEDNIATKIFKKLKGENKSTFVLPDALNFPNIFYDRSGNNRIFATLIALSTKIDKEVELGLKVDSKVFSRTVKDVKQFINRGRQNSIYKKVENFYYDDVTKEKIYSNFIVIVERFIKRVGIIKLLFDRGKTLWPNGDNYSEPKFWESFRFMTTNLAKFLGITQENVDHAIASDFKRDQLYGAFNSILIGPAKEQLTALVKGLVEAGVFELMVTTFGATDTSGDKKTPSMKFVSGVETLIGKLKVTPSWALVRAFVNPAYGNKSISELEVGPDKKSWYGIYLAIGLFKNRFDNTITKYALQPRLQNNTRIPIYSDFKGNQSTFSEKQPITMWELFGIIHSRNAALDGYLKNKSPNPETELDDLFNNTVDMLVIKGGIRAFIEKVYTGETNDKYELRFSINPRYTCVNGQGSTSTPDTFKRFKPEFEETEENSEDFFHRTNELDLEYHFRNQNSLNELKAIYQSWKTTQGGKGMIVDVAQVGNIIYELTKILNKPDLINEDRTTIEVLLDKWEKYFYSINIDSLNVLRGEKPNNFEITSASMLTYFTQNGLAVGEKLLAVESICYAMSLLLQHYEKDNFQMFDLLSSNDVLNLQRTLVSPVIVVAILGDSKNPFNSETAIRNGYDNLEQYLIHNLNPENKAIIELETGGNIYKFDFRVGNKSLLLSNFLKILIEKDRKGEINLRDEYEIFQYGENGELLISVPMHTTNLVYELLNPQLVPSSGKQEGAMLLLTPISPESGGGNLPSIDIPSKVYFENINLSRCLSEAERKGEIFLPPWFVLLKVGQDLYKLLGQESNHQQVELALQRSFLTKNTEIMGQILRTYGIEKTQFESIFGDLKFMIDLYGVENYVKSIQDQTGNITKRAGQTIPFFGHIAGFASKVVNFIFPLSAFERRVALRTLVDISIGSTLAIATVNIFTNIFLGGVSFFTIGLASIPVGAIIGGSILTSFIISGIARASLVFYAKGDTGTKKMVDGSTIFNTLNDFFQSDFGNALFGLRKSYEIADRNRIKEESLKLAKFDKNFQLELGLIGNKKGFMEKVFGKLTVEQERTLDWLSNKLEKFPELFKKPIQVGVRDKNQTKE